MVMCLCNPIFPPSGVSIGSIIPHWDEFNSLGPTTFALGSIGRLIFRKCDMKAFQLRRFKSWTTPTRLVFAWDPQFPLNAFLKPCSTIRSLKNDLKLDSMREVKLSWYLLSSDLPLFFICFFSFREKVSSSLYSPLW